MNTYILISIVVTLIYIFIIEKNRLKARSSVQRKKGLAILAGSMIFLFVSSAARISPFASIGLVAFSCGLFWQLKRKEGQLHRSTSPRQQKALLMFLFGCMAGIMLSCVNSLPLSIRVGLGGVLIILSFSVAIAHFIRLRAWVLASLIAFSSFSAFFVEGLFSQPSQAYTIIGAQTIKAGAYIVDMGVSTQTVGNGLKPYGLVYELVVKKGIPVKWAIDPNKAREGTDFTYSGKAYKGGPFIIEKGFAADAAATIALWKTQGVIVDGPTTADFTAPIFTSINNFPNAVLDLQNGAIAQAYYSNAGIPASTSGAYGSFTTYRSDYPSSLTSCDDLFVLPHADPTWSNHSNLIAFNQNRGFIWAACHAVSVLERLDDPTDADTLPDMNFLSHVPPKIQDSASLKLFGTHAAPTVGPYQYSNNSSLATPYGYSTSNLWAYPIMQFLGKIDLATQNGSEQIYIPDVGGAQWRDQTTIAVYDDNNTDTVVVPTKGIAPPSSQIKAAKMIYGPGFGNFSNGIVMYEGGHSLAKATGPDNIAAQRAFFNWVLLAGIVRGIDTDILVNGVSKNAVDRGTATPPSIAAGATIPVQANASGGSGSYRYQWYSSCGGSFANATAQSTTYTAPASPGTCAIRAVITDGCNRRSYAAFPDIAITGPQADLSILKTDGQTVAKAGSPIVYTITVTNNGPTTAQSLNITDNIPATILNPVFTPSTGSFSYSSSTGIGTWTGLNLAQGQAIALTLKGTVSGSATGNLVNTASVAPLGGLTDPNSANNSSTDTDTIAAPSASISVSKDNGVTQVNKDGLIVYTIKVTNAGPDPIVGLQIEDQAIRFASGNSTVDTAGTDVLDNLTLSVSKGTLSAAKTAFDNNTKTIFASNFGTLTWQNVNLAVGESATLTMSASSKVDQTKGDLKNTVKLTPLNSSGASMGTAASASDQDQIVATITEVDLKAVKTLLTTPNPAPGEKIQYQIEITNAKNTATNAIIADNIPFFVKPLPPDSAVTWTCTATRGSGDTQTACGAASGQVDSNNALRTTATVKNATSSKVIYTVTGKIDASATGNLVNTATVSPQAGEFEKKSNVNDNDSTHTLALTRKAKLQVTKTDGQIFAAPGSPLVYTIVIQNSGPSLINSVKVTDVIPKTILNPTFAVSNGTFSPMRAAGTTADTWTGDWTNLDLIPGSVNTDKVTLTVSGTLDPSALAGTNNLTNTVTVDKPSSFPNSSYGTTYTVDTANSTLTATDIDSIKPIADLSVTKTDNQSTAIPGQATSYIITVTNNGPSTVNSLTLNDSLPAALSNPLFEPSVGTYNSVTKLWNGFALQPSQSVTLILSGTIDAAATGTLTNTVTVTPAGGVDDPTPNDSDDSATDTTALTPQADLAISKSDGNLAVNPGEAITYTLRVTNLGPSTVNSIKIIDPLPSPFTPASFTPSTGTYDSATGNWIGLIFKAGDTITLAVSGTVSSSFPKGTLTNTATVIPPSGVTDSIISNNSSTDTTTVPRPTGTIDLSITKTNNNTASLVPGSDVNYVITVTNNSGIGGSSVNSLTMNDPIPPDLVDAFFATADGTYDPLTGTLTLSQSLLPGSSVSLLLSGTLSTSPTGKTLKNTATVVPPVGFTDPNLANNTATDEDPIQSTVTSSPNLLLVKRITRINGLTTHDGKDLAAYTDIASYPYDDNAPDNPVPNPPDTDKWPLPFSQSLPGAVSAGNVKPGDVVEYTIYYLSAGSAPAQQVVVCDRIPSNQAFTPNAFNSLATAPNPAKNYPVGDRGIAISQGGTTFSYTNLGNDDAAQYYPPGSVLPSACIQSTPSEDNGTITVDLGTLPDATSPGVPVNAYGFLRFHAKVK